MHRRITQQYVGKGLTWLSLFSWLREKKIRAKKSWNNYVAKKACQILCIAMKDPCAGVLGVSSKDPCTKTLQVPLQDVCVEILCIPLEQRILWQRSCEFPRILVARSTFLKLLRRSCEFLTQRSWKSPQARGPRIGTVNADTTSPQHTTYNLLIFSSIPGWENTTSWQTFLGLAHVPQVGAYWILDQGGQGAVQTGHSTAQEVPMTLVSACRSVTKDVPVTVRRSRTWAIQNGLKAGSANRKWAMRPTRIEM